MSNNLSITDFPFLPLKPQPSKRMILVIMAFVATFILTLAIILAKSLLGKTVQSTSRAEKYTGLKFLSAFPSYSSIDKMVIVEELNQSILSHFRSNFMVQNKEAFQQENEPVIVTISSIKKGEGKTFTGRKIVDKFTEYCSSILYLSNDEIIFDNPIKVTSLRYKQDENFQNAVNFSDWLLKLGVKKSDYSIIIIELEELSKFSVPDALLNGVHSNLLVLSAERVWAESDSRALNLFTSLTDVKPMILLNMVELDRLEAIIGEIPKRRSNARRIAKRVVTFDFKKA
jgi:polysaccharide biosynthesis transport protein